MNKEQFDEDFNFIACLGAGVEMIDQGRRVLEKAVDKALLNDLDLAIDRVMKEIKISAEKIRENWTSEK